ncbi:unnamed protein product, partial [Lampetra planeri]
RCCFHHMQEDMEPDGGAAEDLTSATYRIMVEILNENDNSPVFAENTVQSLIISEPDAEYFRVDLPNSGEVILSKALDFETKNQLSVTIPASEMSTVEHFSTSTNVTITVQDGDDQYPQFLPCTLVFQDQTSHICTSPVYTVNITEVDGDRGLSSPVSYAILSGDDDGRFLIDNETGEGFNPMIYFTFSPASNHTGIYQVTQEGLLIARTNQLKPKQKHSLERWSIEEDQPCTSLDQPEQTEQHCEEGDAGSPPQDRRPSADSRGGGGVGDEDDDGFLGDEDADKNSEGDDELEPDEEELLRVMARCNPIFITFTK